MYIFGQSHLFGGCGEGGKQRKSARTLAMAALLDEYRLPVFMCSRPCLHVAENYPQLYARLMDKVQSGQIMVEGGMWVEADTNMRPVKA